MFQMWKYSPPEGDEWPSMSCCFCFLLSWSALAGKCPDPHRP